MSKDLKGLSTTNRSCGPLSGRARTCPASILSNIKQYLCQMGLVICYGLRVAGYGLPRFQRDFRFATTGFGHWSLITDHRSLITVNYSLITDTVHHLY